MTINKGDHVSWNTEQGRTRGSAVERKTRDFQLAGQKFTASEQDPMFVVQSDKTNARASHKTNARASHKTNARASHKENALRELRPERRAGSAAGPMLDKLRGL